MSDGLKLMIYDGNPGNGDIWQKFLKTTWKAGGWLNKLRGKLDGYSAVSSWREAVLYLSTVEPGKKIREIQFWGHGSPGAVYISRVPFTTHSVTALRESLAKVRDRLTPDAVIWFRTCSTFQGRVGQEFAIRVSDFFGCTVAGHTMTIGPFQPGLHTLKPSALPSWAVDEGAGKPLLPRHFFWWHKNTVLCLATEIPEGW